MNLNKIPSVKMSDKWFKLTIENKETLEIDHAYVTGLHKEIVRQEYQKSLGSQYFVFSAPIEYDQIIRELDNEPEH